MEFDLLPYALSLLTIVVMVLAGQKDKRAWLLGLANQALWLVFIWHTKSWGLLVLLAALVVVYSRNYLRWKDEDV